MTDFGVVPEGFREKTYQDILTAFEQAQRVAFGPAINTQADSVLGQLNGIIADQLAELWEASLAVYRSRHPDSASGEALDAVAAITGALRLPAAPSVVTLYLNLNSGTTVPAGSVARIGSSGSRWVTTEAVTNSTGVAATLPVSAESEDSAPIVGNAEAIDSIATPVSGWTAKAALTNLGAEPYKLADSQTLDIKVNDGPEQTVTFLAGDFADIGLATASEVAAVIDAAISGLSAFAVGSSVRLESDTSGTGSAVQVVGGSALPALAFSVQKIKGFNPDQSAKLLNTQNEPYSLLDGQVLFVKIDGGGTQTVTFLSGDFLNITTATALEVARVLARDLAGAVAYELAGKVQIESETYGINSEVEVIDGTANVELGFPDEEPVAGVAGDATLGRNVEPDAEFRLRREELLRAAGAGTLEAIRAAVRSVDGVVQAFAFENPTDSVDAFGRPPHTFEIVVRGGENQDIGEAIFLSKPAGIGSYKVPGVNGVTVTVEDSQGTLHDINFSRANEIEFYIEVDVVVEAALFGGGNQLAGEQQVKEALKATGEAFGIGETLVITRFLCAPLPISGVKDVASVKVDSVFPPVNIANIPLTDRDIGRFSTANITVNVSFV